jgi:hypothetical protein
MDAKKPENQFQEVQRKAREMRERMRGVQARDSELRDQKTRDEAAREGFEPIEK